MEVKNIKKIYILVEDGMVKEVRSEDVDIEVVVLDKDSNIPKDVDNIDYYIYDVGYYELPKIY